jgi:hypothetical protein
MTGQLSTFYLECQTARGEKSFIGIEVKYHENLEDQAARHRPEYDKISAQMGCFGQDTYAFLKQNHSSKSGEIIYFLVQSELLMNSRTLCSWCFTLVKTMHAEKPLRTIDLR